MSAPPFMTVPELRAELEAAHFVAGAALPGWTLHRDHYSREADRSYSMSVSEAFRGERRVWEWMLTTWDSRGQDFVYDGSGSCDYPRQAMRAAERAAGLLAPEPDTRPITAALEAR